MKNIFILALAVFCISCSSSGIAETMLEEDELFITRKFIGIYMDYRHTGSENFSGTNLIWIKTSMENNYGKISAYGKKCDFSVGDRLYLRRSFYSPGLVSAYWVYYIENDSTISYRVTEFQNDRKINIGSLY